MSLKIFLSVVGGMLAILCGEAVKLNLTEWHQLTLLQYWLGVGVQTAGLFTALAGMLYQPSPENPK